MKIILIFLITYSCGVLSQEDECDKNNKSKIIDESKNIKPIKISYIQHVARDIFNDETSIYDFIGINCMKALIYDEGVWNCFIRQSATKFENGYYTVNPPDAGEWILEINFNNNTYLLK